MLHVVQYCHFNALPRMQRHDAICRLLQTECEKKGHTLLWEPIFTTRSGRLKPYIVVVAGNTIIDVSVVTENMRYEHMAGASRLKDIWNAKPYYYNRTELREELSKRYAINNFFCGAVILSLRGIWRKDNGKSLEACDIPLSRRRYICGAVYGAQHFFMKEISWWMYLKNLYLYLMNEGPLIRGRIKHLGV